MFWGREAILREKIMTPASNKIQERAGVENEQDARTNEWKAGGFVWITRERRVKLVLRPNQTSQTSQTFPTFSIHVSSLVTRPTSFIPPPACAKDPQLFFWPNLQAWPRLQRYHNRGFFTALFLNGQQNLLHTDMGLSLTRSGSSLSGGVELRWLDNNFLLLGSGHLGLFGSL
jgi:hypothetical protein